MKQDNDPMSILEDGMLDKMEGGIETLNDYKVNDDIQLTVRENHKKQGQPVFVLPDGKIGFPSKDSIPVNIGDVVSGKISMITNRYVFITASEVLHKSKSGV